MRFVVAAVGRLKEGAERELYERYSERFDAQGRGISFGPLKLAEMPESRAQTSDLRKGDEAERLLKVSDGADVQVALHETGRGMTSDVFAAWLAKQRDGGAKAAAFMVGGPDGHGDAVLQKATMCLSLGPMTLPHGLARVILAEQLYRAVTILSGHPYHRA